MRALVVGDHEGSRKEMGDMLAKASFQVYEAAEVREAMKILAGLWPMDLALVDWGLPKGGALRLVRTVRASRDHDAMRVIMVTARLEMTEIFEAIRAGVDDYLAKPVSRKKILEKLVDLRFYSV